MVRILHGPRAADHPDRLCAGLDPGGWATPAEASACGAFGAILLSALYRKLTIPGFYDALIKSLEITVLIMFLVAASNFFGAVFSNLGTPKMLTELLLSLDMSPILILMMIMALIFLLGWPLEWVPIVLIIVPILIPTVFRWISALRTQ